MQADLQEEQHRLADFMLKQFFLVVSIGTANRLRKRFVDFNKHCKNISFTSQHRQIVLSNLGSH